MTDPASTRMFAEAAETGAVVARQLAANREAVAALAADLLARPPAGVLTCARGSSDHAATYAKYLIETGIGRVVASAAPSVSSLYGAEPATAAMLAIAISQSGRSPDVLAALDMVGKAGGRTLALVNDVASPLARAAGTTLPLHAGLEKSVAATKSYIASLAAIGALVAAWGRNAPLAAALDALPALLEQAWEEDWSALVERLAGVRGLYVIGRGPGLAVAQEAALKFKETCGLHAEAFSAAEVRHGPMALIGPDFPVLVFRQSDEAAAGIDALVAELVARGGDVLVAGVEAPGATLRLPVTRAHPWVEPILAIQSFYRAVNALAVRRGFDPDVPPHLAKVTETI